MSSERVAIHFTGRPSFSAAAAATRCSTYGDDLGPKPPPTHPHTTRNLAGSRPSIGAYSAWIECGAWWETPVGGHGQDAVGLHRNAGQALAHHGDLGDDIRAGERVGVALLRERGAEAHVRSVIGKQQWSLGQQRGERAHDRRQGVVIDD